MRRRRSVIGLAAALAVAALAGTGASAQEAPATETAPAEVGRSISGTIRGIDGRLVNAQISLVLRDSQDRPITMDGTVTTNRGAYAETVSMNPGAPLDGLVSGGEDHWRIDGLPSNAHHLTLEVYPRDAGSGAGNFTHYGGAVKRNLRLPSGQGLSGIDIVFPLNCTNVPGGTTGSIRVRRYVNGQPVGNLSKFVATGADFPPFGIQGFRDQRVIPAGDAAPEFDGLAPDQAVRRRDLRPRVPVHVLRSPRPRLPAHRRVRLVGPAVAGAAPLHPVAGRRPGSRHADRRRLRRRRG